MISARHSIIALVLVLFSIPALAYGDNVAPPPLTIATVNVSDTCTASDGAGHSVTYAQSGQFLGICALLAAKDQGAISSYTLSYDPSFGFYLASLNGTTPSATQFWDIFQNNAEAQVGLSSMTIASGDVLKFQLTDWSNSTTVGSPITFQIGTLTTTPVAPVSTTGGGGLSLHDPFNVEMALYFLRANQHKDGSFDSVMLDDWIAIAAANGGAGDLQKALSSYESSHPLTLTSVTDNERHAMALESLGINPYSGDGVDYITPIVKSFDGTQIGDPQLINDDIFAIFPLLHAGYTVNDDLIQKTIANIVASQGADGSWMESVDMTAAAIQALELAPAQPGVAEALRKAEHYLHGAQQKDGGFDNADATSWMMQAIAALGESVFDWDPSSYHMPDYYLATKQERDGGVEPVSTELDTRLWATAYAVPGIEHKTWDQLLAYFPKPSPVAANTSSAGDATTTVAAPAASTTVPTAADPTVPAPTASDTQIPIPAAQSSSTPANTTSSDNGAENAPNPSAQAAAAGAISFDPMDIFPILIILIILGAAALLWRNNRNAS